MLEILKYAFLGIVQGITEVFPVSSSGHLAIFSHLFEMDMDNFVIFLMITNIGSLLAMILFFHKRILRLTSSLFGYAFDKDLRKDEERINDVHYILKLLLAAIPVGILGFIINYFNLIPYDLIWVGSALLVTASSLIIVFILRKRVFDQEVTYKKAGVIGVFQMLAVVPGISRSGITLVGALSNRVEMKKALDFSFLLYIVVSIPVSILGIIDAANASESINWAGYTIAFGLSFGFTLITLQLLYKFVKVKNFLWFAVYCVIAGTFAIILHFI
jgi:undecaprenyl-diphosphatase